MICNAGAFLQFTNLKKETECRRILEDTMAAVMAIGQHSGSAMTYSGPRFTTAQAQQMKRLSITQLTMGALTMLIGIVLMVLEKVSGSYTGAGGLLYGGYGIMIGGYFLYIGALGIVAVRQNIVGWILTTMIWNILSACMFWIGLIAFAFARLYSINNGRIFRQEPDFSLYEANYNAIIAMNSLLIVIAVIEFIMAIWSAVLCHRAAGTCCCYYNQPAVQDNSSPTIVSGASCSCSNNPSCLEHQLQLQAKNCPNPVKAVQQSAHYAGKSEAPPSYYSCSHSESDPQPAGCIAQSQAPPSYNSVSQSQGDSHTECRQPPEAVHSHATHPTSDN